MASTKKIRLLPSRKEIPIAEGETLLSALENAGYALPNNCRAGACGECKAKVCSGEIDQGFVLDMALPSSEREAGMALMCMALPTSDLIEIEYGTPNALPELFPPQEHLPYMVVERQAVTPNMLKISLLSLGESLRFWPGQFVRVGGKGGTPTAFSLANTPNREGRLVFFAEKSECREQLGEKVELSGPYGSFIGNPGAETDVLCLAEGRGLAAISSLASAALLRGGFHRPAKVIFSAPVQEELFEMGHFAFLQAKFQNFQFTYTLTAQKNASGLEGRIPNLLPQHYPHLKNTSVYIAGTEPFVAECTRAAAKLGAAHIHRESFSDQHIN